MKSRLGWALLVLLGTGVVAGGCGDGKECGEGTVAMGDRCVPESTVTCGTGTMLDMEVCVPVAPEDPVSCGTGTTLNTATGECEPDVTCAPGTVAMSGRCVPDGSVICTGNTTYDASTGTCVIDEGACAEGTVLVGGECVPFDDSLMADVYAAAEPDTRAYGGTGATFTPPAIGGTVTLGGCITPVDFDGDGEIDIDEDVFDFTVTAPGLYDMRIDGLNGLSAAFAVISPDALLDDWQRLAVDLTSDGAQRKIWLPRAGQYGIVVTDARSLLSGLPAGSEDACYFMSIEALPTPAPTPLTADTRLGTLGDPQFFSVAASGDTVFRVEVEADDPTTLAAVVTARGATFDAHGAATSENPTSAAAFSGVVRNTESLTVIVDHVYEFAIGTVPYELSITRTREAAGTVSVPHVEGYYTFFFFEGTAGDIVRFEHTSGDPIMFDIINPSITQFVSRTCDGAPCASSTRWLQLTETGRNILRIYNPSGVDGTPYDVTFTRQAYTPTALTAGTPARITLAGGYGFATADASVDWGRFHLANLTGTGFTAAQLAWYPREVAGSLRLPSGPAGDIFAFDAATASSELSRIWVPTAPGQILIAVYDASGTFDGDEALDLSFGPEPHLPVTVMPGTTVNRADVVIAAAARKLFLVRGDAGSEVTITVTGEGGADAAIARLDRTATRIGSIVDATGADQAEVMTATIPGPGWLAFAVDAGSAGGTVDVTFDATVAPYRIETSSRTFIDACATGTQLANGDDVMAPTRTLATFTSFEYFGAPVTAFRASTNGWLTFDGSYVSWPWLFLSDESDETLVAPLTGDLVTRVCMLESASQLIVQWQGNPYGKTTVVQMQAVFVAGSNEIHFVYGPNHTAVVVGGFEEVGIASGEDGVYIDAASRMATGTAFRFVPN